MYDKRLVVATQYKHFAGMDKDATGRVVESYHMPYLNNLIVLDGARVCKAATDTDDNYFNRPHLLVGCGEFREV